jgi:aminoglycoside phosphotransferase (APT) family kinase protein
MTDIDAIRAVVHTVFGSQVPIAVEPVGDGISTVVYRLGRGQEIFYLRVLPDTGDSFASEAHVHTLLRRRGVHVPEVIYLEDCHALLQRSVMITAEIRGRHAGHLPPGAAASTVVREAGRELAILNSIPVEGFGWIRRDSGAVSRLEAELPSNRAFLLGDLEPSLQSLTGTVLKAWEVSYIRDLLRLRSSWLDAGQGHLAHGDFDLTHIYQDDGRYTGIIDFGEIRGAGSYYDLGHFRLHDGESASYQALPSLLAGYGEVAPLPPGVEQRIAFLSLLIGIRLLARAVQGLMRQPLSAHAKTHALASIQRDLVLLRAE